MFKKVALALFVLYALSTGISAQSHKHENVTIIDSRHFSNVFGEIRNYRIFLPPGYYENTQKRYPVIYFYHGWSQRYFGSGPDGYNHYEKGDDNGGDNIADFVSKNEVIVVKPDGYNRSPEEEYYLRPYNIGPVETSRQFPLYFPELVSHIDAFYKTNPDRNHRAVSGLSMGGFMSFWIGGKYPDLICAIGNFCGSAEFVVGPKDIPVEYRNIDLFNNYNGVKVRLNYGDEDFIRFYHRDLNKVWLQVMDNYEYEIYEAAHSTCGMGEMFGFLKEAFANPPEKPATWNHIDVYPDFTVWGYMVNSDRVLPGFTVLERVNTRGFRCSVRQHLPDGELQPDVSLSVSTPPLYEKNTFYLINDIDIKTGEVKSYQVKSDNEGSLRILTDGGIHEIGINRASDKPESCISSFSFTNMNYATHLSDVRIRITVLNKGVQKGEGVRATLTPFRKSVLVSKSEADFGTVKMNETISSGSDYVFHTLSDTTIIERFKLTITDIHNNSWIEYLDLPVYRKDLPEINNFQIADGRKLIVASRGISNDTVILGNGNGDGIANPGESVVILVRDGDSLRRTELLEPDEQLNVHGENKRLSDYWGTYDHVGGSAKYSVPVISSSCPQNHLIGAVVEYWMPDYPNHIIKQGKVKIKVSGKDTTSPLIEWIKVTGDNKVMVKIIDGSEVKQVSVRFTNQSDPLRSFEAELKNDGLSEDISPDDTVFSFTLPVRGFGFYSAEVSATDLCGNSSVIKDPGIFVVH
jgi:poly(3-hydroxybutyrate) depolymerase